MKEIQKVKSITLWIFIVPFFALNACLILITKFHGLFPNPGDIITNTIPYIDGGTSISRTARVFPTYLIFKPAMFYTSYLLIKYWLSNKNIISNYDSKNKHINKIVFFGVGSAILLTIHSIFLGVKFDITLYKLFRRVVMVSFIIFVVLMFVSAFVVIKENSISTAMKIFLTLNALYFVLLSSLVGGSFRYRLPLHSLYWIVNAYTILYFYSLLRHHFHKN